MSIAAKITIEHLRAQSTALSCDDQHKLASLIASNVGCVLVPERPMEPTTEPLTAEQITERLVVLDALQFELRERVQRIEGLIKVGRPIFPG